jgi:hypothetical protein
MFAALNWTFWDDNVAFNGDNLDRCDSDVGWRYSAGADGDRLALAQCPGKRIPRP